jgi:NitT/TauT family transport system permease protein
MADPVRGRSRRFSPDERRRRRYPRCPEAFCSGCFVLDARRNSPTNLRAQHRRWALTLAPIVLAAVLGLWQLIVTLGDYPTFLLPTPGRVWQRLAQVWRDGTLLMHTLVTLREVLGGLALGLTVAVLLGYALAKSPLLETILSPYLVASQAIPIVALAPLLVIWFGPGSLSKVLVCALTLFFPVLVNTVVGVRSVDVELRELLRSLEATPAQVVRYLELPAALPVLFGGLKVGATLSVIGAVVSEFVSSDRGLGFLVNLARGLFDTPLMFVALFTLMAMALGLYGCVSLIESLVLRWRVPRRQSPL